MSASAMSASSSEEDYESEAFSVAAAAAPKNRISDNNKNESDESEVQSDNEEQDASAPNTSKRQRIEEPTDDDSSGEEECSSRNNSASVPTGNRNETVLPTSSDYSMSVDSEYETASDEDQDQASASYSSPDHYKALLNSEMESKKKKLKKDVKEMSIHKIELSKWTKGVNKNIKDIEEIIDLIIKSYNYNDPTDGSDSTSKSRFPKKRGFKRDKVTKPPEVRKEDKHYFSGDPFKLRVYSLEIPNEDEFLKGLGIDKTTHYLHLIMFHYRPGELFALTTGQAWHVVQRYSDYDFPIKIASRLLSEKGQIETVSKVLVGEERVTKKTMKEHQKASANSLLELCTSFKAETREDASVLRLFCFQGSSVPSGNGKEVKVTKPAKVKFQITLAAVRILKKLAESDFLSIVDHFSVISRGEETAKYPSGETEIDTDVHLKYVHPVTSDESKRLNIRLANVLRRIINREIQEDTMDPYDVCHKYVEQFALGSKYELWHNKDKRIKEFSDPPSLMDLIDGIRSNKAVEMELLSDANLPNHGNPEAFLNALNQVKLSYHHKDTVYKRECILNYIEGSLIGDDNRPYMRVMSCWCSIRNEYLLVVHSQFLNLLKQHLVAPNDRKNLPFPYTEGENYIEVYREEKEYYIPPENTPEEKKLFDMLRITSTGEFHLIYIVTGLNYRTLVKGRTITKAIETIIRENRRAVCENKELDDFYASHDDFYEIYGSPKDFVEKLSEAKIVLGIANRRVGNEFGRSLTDEKDLELKILPKDIEDLLTEEVPSSAPEIKLLESSFNMPSQTQTNAKITVGDIEKLSGHLAEALAESEYIHENGAITSKLLFATRNNFRLPGFRAAANAFVYDTIIQGQQSHFPILIPKLELYRLTTYMKQNDKEFIISEIQSA